MGPVMEVPVPGKERSGFGVERIYGARAIAAGGNFVCLFRNV